MFLLTLVCSLKVFKPFSRSMHYIFEDEERVRKPTAGLAKEGKSTWNMPTFGKLDEYNETKDWHHYIERVNHFFEANEIKDPGKRRFIFLVCVGAKTYKLVLSLVAPEDPKDRSYEDLPKLLQDHFMPKPSTIPQRFKFSTRSPSRVAK